MVTHYPRHAATQPIAADVRSQPAEPTATRVLDWIRQAYCGLHGHDTMLHFEKDRMFLQCVSCGHQTPGWDLDLDEIPRATVAGHGEPAVTVHAEPRHAVLRPHLVSARRIA
jgi:hypothetical protein